MHHLSIKKLKPRNPHVVPALLRAAGAHRANESRTRQQTKRRLRAELNEIHPPPMQDA